MEGDLEGFLGGFKRGTVFNTGFGLRGSLKEVLTGVCKSISMCIYMSGCVVGYYRGMAVVSVTPLSPRCGCKSF